MMADYNGSSYSQLTPLTRMFVDTSIQLTSAHLQTDVDSQGMDSDDSQTCVKQLFVSSHQRIDVTAENVDQLYKDIRRRDSQSPPDNTYWPLIGNVQHLFRTATKAVFIYRIISEADSREDRLDKIRNTVFAACKDHCDYPFPKDVDMKRRKKTRKGEKFMKKIASDIYV